MVVVEAPARPRGLRVRTTCATEAEFIALYLRNCDAESVFAPTAKMIPEGADCAFSLELADGQPMLRGLGVVVGSWSTPDNRFSAAGVQIAFVQLTTGTQPILERVLEARDRAEGKPARARPSPITQRRIAMADEEPERPGETEDESLVREVRRSITRELQAASSGAPAEMIDDRASHTSRYEGPLRAPAIPVPSSAIRAQLLRNRPTRPPPIPAQLPALPPPKRPIAAAPAIAAAPLAIAPEPAALPDPPTYPGADAFDQPPTTPEAPAFARGTPVPPEVVPAPEVVADAPVAATAPRRFETAVTRVVARFAPARAWLEPRLAKIGYRQAPTLGRIATWLAPRKERLVTRLGPMWTRFVAWLRPVWTRLVTWLRPAWPHRRIAAVFVSGIVVGFLLSHWTRSGSETPREPIASAMPARCAPDSPAIAQPAPPPAAVAAAIVPAPPAPPTPHKPAAKVARVKPTPAPTAKARPAVAAKPAPPTPVTAKPKPASPTQAVKPATAKQTHPATKSGKCNKLDCL
jgi:hypothetical protein